MSERAYFRVVATAIVVLGALSIGADNVPAAIIAAALMVTWAIGSHDLT